MAQADTKNAENTELLIAKEVNYFVIRQPSDLAACQQLRKRDGFHLRPVIDLSGQFKDFADLSLNLAQPDHQKKIDEISNIFKFRRDELPVTSRRNNAEFFKFLTWLYVSSDSFRLVYDPSSKASVSHSPFAPVENAAIVAHHLYKKGLLSRKFFDRFHQCNSCKSTRVNVREECMTCRSANIEEVEIIHHFTCAWQGPESDYVQGRDLVCPKCAKHLTHYGSDYEKSGSVIHCHDCHDNHSVASVGFICLDCQAHQDSETMNTISHFSYQITDKGIAFIMADHAVPYQEKTACLGQSHSLDIKVLPLALQQEVIALRLGIAESRNEGINPFVIMEFSYSRAYELITQLGEAAFTKLRHRLHDNLRAIIREHDMFEKGATADFLLLKETTKENILDLKNTFLDRCQHEIDHDMGIVIRTFDTEELSYSE